MKKLKLSDMIKHNMQYINFNNKERSLSETIDFYVAHYTDHWTKRQLDCDISETEVREILTCKSHA
jgi:NAD-dependent SIR2 family protein deacetylase